MSYCLFGQLNIIYYPQCHKFLKTTACTEALLQQNIFFPAAQQQNKLILVR